MTLKQHNQQGFERDKEDKNEDAFLSLCGGWQSEESGDELATDIYAARNDQEREVEL